MLDRYHKNRALKKTFSGIERREALSYEAVMRDALDRGGRELFSKARESLLLQWPEQRESIAEGADYLRYALLFFMKMLGFILFEPQHLL